MRRNQRAPPGDAKGIDGLKPPVPELTYHRVGASTPLKYWPPERWRARAETLSRKVQAV